MKKLICAALLVAFGASSAVGALIDFENVPTGSLGRSATIGNVTFESPVDLFVAEYFTAEGTTRALCSRTFGTFGCESNLTITFAEAASQFSLLVDGANSESAQISAFATFFDGATRTIVFDGFKQGTPRTLDFGALQNIRSVTFSTNDPQGFSFDDFSFNNAVPEPATWAMLVCGFGIMGGALRRRRSADANTLIGRT